MNISEAMRKILEDFVHHENTNISDKLRNEMSCKFRSVQIPMENEEKHHLSLNIEIKNDSEEKDIS